MKKYFGTDGIRGEANAWPMTGDIAFLIGQAVGSRFLRGEHEHRVLIGKDTRRSCYMLESALTAGFLSVGMNVILLGPMPTPAVAILTRSLRADAGVMISASHNPFYDNGIKIFDFRGEKLSDAEEEDIEALMEKKGDLSLARAEKLGRAQRDEDARGRYAEFVKGTLPRGISLEGLRIVIDCANGAAYRVAPSVLWELGADIIPLGVTPNGRNINEDCGSTHPEYMAKAVKEMGADIGIALDGDADRLILVDEKGEIVDGDHIMGFLARGFLARNRLAAPAVVSTLMSNGALEVYLKEALCVELIRTQVGDRYVLEQMRKRGANLGGEPSGHVVLSDYSTTGDGLLAALQVLSFLLEFQMKASEIRGLFSLWPQVMKTVYCRREDNPLTDPAIAEPLKALEKRIASEGRLVVRKSGTEPKVRIMVEARDHTLAEGYGAEALHILEKGTNGKS